MASPAAGGEGCGSPQARQIPEEEGSSEGFTYSPTPQLVATRSSQPSDYQPNNRTSPPPNRRGDILVFAENQQLSRREKTTTWTSSSPRFCHKKQFDETRFIKPSINNSTSKSLTVYHPLLFAPVPGPAKTCPIRRVCRLSNKIWFIL